MEDLVELLHSEISMSSEPSTSSIPFFGPKTFPDRKFDTVVMNPPFGSWNKVNSSSNTQ